MPQDYRCGTGHSCKAKDELQVPLRCFVERFRETVDIPFGAGAEMEGVCDVESGVWTPPRNLRTKSRPWVRACFPEFPPCSPLTACD